MSQNSTTQSAFSNGLLRRSTIIGFNHMNTTGKVPPFKSDIDKQVETAKMRA